MYSIATVRGLYNNSLASVHLTYKLSNCCDFDIGVLQDRLIPLRLSNLYMNISLKIFLVVVPALEYANDLIILDEFV